MHAAHQDGDLQSWSLDLIQNLPAQSFEHWDDQLDQAIGSQAPHLSVYDLSVEPGTVLPAGLSGRSWTCRRKTWRCA